MTSESLPVHRPPLGIPSGSVRALIAMLVVAVVVCETWRGNAMTVLLAETLMVVLAHYFTSRRLVKLPPDMRQRLEQDGTLVPEPHPLYLPRHAVRVLVILAFAAVAAGLVYQDRLWTSEALATLGIVLAYFLGIVVSAFVRWWSARRAVPRASLRWWEDGKAIVALGMAAVLAAAFLFERPDLLPGWFRNGAFGVILFYYGSR